MGRRVVAVLVALAAVLGTGLGSVGLLDYDEAAYAEVAREMVLAGDYLAPQLNGEPWFEKPPLLYWVQALGYHGFGIGEWGARAGNLLAALALLATLYAVARRPLGDRAAFLSMSVLGTSLLFLALSRIVLTDMILSLWFVAALGCVHRALEDERAGRHGRGWIALAAFWCSLAMLTKGAIGVLLPGGALVLTALIERRRRLLLRFDWWAISAVLFLGLGCSWYLLLGLHHEQGFAFMGELFWDHHVGRFLGSKQGHGGPFFYYLPVLLLGFLPWSPLVWFAARGPELRADDERGRFLRLFAVFGVQTFLFFSLAATKLPNYMTPVFPVLALLCGVLLSGPAVERLRENPAYRLALRGLQGLFVTLAVALCSLPLLIPRLPDLLGEDALKQPGLSVPLDIGPSPILAGALLLVAVAASWREESRGRSARAWAVIGACFLAFVATLFHGLYPRYDAHFHAPLRALSQAASERSEGRPVVLIHLRHRPSVVFYGGTPTQYVSRRDPQQLAETFSAPEGRWAITTESYLEKASESASFRVVERAGGYVLVLGRPRPSVP